MSEEKRKTPKQPKENKSMECDQCWGKGWDENPKDVCIYCEGRGKDKVVKGQD